MLRNLVPIERQVSDEGRWYQTRLQPYRTLEDHIAGVVLTCVDVTERREATDLMAMDFAATRQLSEVAATLVQDEDVEGLLDTVLDAAVAIMHADAGTLQLCDAQGANLHLLTQRGLPAHVAEHFARIDMSSGTAIRQALEEGRRILMHFGANQPDPSGSNRWHREEAGLLTGQATPLIARDGHALGMLSTYWKTSHLPSERELRFFDLLVRQAADAIERKQSSDLLHAQMDELQRFNTAFIGRETRMIELKKEINGLLTRLGEPPRYDPAKGEEESPLPPA